MPVKKPVVGVLVIGVLTVFAVSTFSSQMKNTPQPTITPQNVSLLNSEALLGITPQPNGDLCSFDPMWSDPSAWEDMIANPPTAAGIGYSMSDTDMPGTRLIGADTVRIEPNSPTTGTFHVFYAAAEDEPSSVKIRYILLIDEQQVLIDGQQLYAEVTLKSGQEALLAIAIPPFAPGIHDLIIIALVADELNAYGEIRTLPYRMSFVAGETFPPVEQTYQRLQPAVTKSQDLSYFTLGVHTDESQLSWVYPDIYKQVEGSLDFFISAGYMENEGRMRERGITAQPMTTAFVGLLEGQQIALSDGSDAFYAEISPDNTYSFIPISVDATGYTGKQELTILRIDYPRIPMCWVLGGGENYAFSNYISGKQYGVDFGE